MRRGVAVVAGIPAVDGQGLYGGMLVQQLQRVYTVVFDRVGMLGARAV